MWQIQRRVLKVIISSNNVLTDSLGLGVAFSVWDLITFEILFSGILFTPRAALTCCDCNSNLLSSLVGMFRDLLMRVVAVLILCFKSWCEALCEYK